MLNELMERYPSLRCCEAEIERARDMILDTYRRGGKILVCGNGGSAADSDHIVGELMKGFILPRKMDKTCADKFKDALGDESEELVDRVREIAYEAIDRALHNSKCDTMQLKQRIKDDAEKVSYKNLQKNRAEDQGKVMSLYGPVTSVSEGGGTHYVRIQYNKGSDGAWFNPVVIVAQEEMGVKVGDMLGVVATVAGVFEEQDASGSAVNVPRLELVFVDKVE